MKKSFPPHRLLALLACVLTACSPQDKKPGVAPPAPVEVIAVRVETVPLELQAVGTVQPLASVQLKARVSGAIQEVKFADGATVAEGDTLFVIDPKPFALALDRAEANLASTQATASNADEQLKRYGSLTTSGSASREQYSQFRTTARSQESDLDARRADVAEARLSLEWTSVKAPISGRAGAALLKAGNLVQAGGDVLAVIHQMRPIYVTFSVPEQDLSRVREWMARGTLAVMARDPDSGRELATGTLGFIDNAVDQTTGMIALKAVFSNADEGLWPGQFVDLTLRLTEEKDVLVIPTMAISEGQNGPQVLVVKDDIASLRKIEVERTHGSLSIVQSGLQAGETVITSGQLRVTPGAKVAPRESTETGSLVKNPSASATTPTVLP